METPKKKAIIDSQWGRLCITGGLLLLFSGIKELFGMGWAMFDMGLLLLTFGIVNWLGSFMDGSSGDDEADSQ